MSADNEKLKILLVPNTLFFPPFLDDLLVLEASGEIPRSWVHDLDGDILVLDQRLLTNPSSLRQKFYGHLPMWMVQVLEVHRTGRNYDVVFLWSVANVALVLALLLIATRRKIKLVPLFTRISEPRKSLLLKLVHHKFARIVLPPASQREFANTHLGIPKAKLVGLPWTTDTLFWRDTWQQEKMMICAAGGEMRDYPTLVKAMTGLGIPCHIAGVLESDRPDWWNASDEDRRQEKLVAGNITFGTMSAVELRRIYAQSRFVVVPLHETNSDNGITCMNESWAMGIPVIVSQVDGQQEAFGEGIEGMWVRQGDPQALRRAILTLWNDPAASCRMGRAGRKRVESDKTHRIFSDGLNELFSEISREQ